MDVQNYNDGEREKLKFVQDFIEGQEYFSYIWNTWYYNYFINWIMLKANIKVN